MKQPLLMLFFLFFCFCDGLLVLQDSKTTYSAFLMVKTPNFKTDEFKEFSGTLMLGSPFSGCTIEEPSRYRNKFILVTGNACSEEHRIRLAQKEGISGIISDFKNDFGAAYKAVSFRLENRDFIEIPYFYISEDSLKELRDILTTNGTVEITIKSDPNPWYNMGKNAGIWIWQITLSLWSLINCGLSANTLRRFVNQQGFRITVPQTGLWIEIIANIMRFVFLIVDPLIVRLTYSAVEHNILSTLSMPWSWADVLLMTLWWHQISQKRLKNALTGVDKMRIPFLISFILLVILQLGLTSAASVTSDAEIPWNAIIGAIFLILSICQVIFFVICGTRLLRMIQSFSDDVKEKHGTLIRITRLVLFSALGSTIYIIGGLIMAVPSAFYSRDGLLAGWTLIFVGLNFASTAQILSYHPTAIEPDSSRSPKNRMSSGQYSFSETTPGANSTDTDSAEIQLENSSIPNDTA